ncbi:MAG: FHA domain-containing protein [Tessaracoccus sp.]
MGEVMCPHCPEPYPAGTVLCPVHANLLVEVALNAMPATQLMAAVPPVSETSSATGQPAAPVDDEPTLLLCTTCYQPPGSCLCRGPAPSHTALRLPDGSSVSLPDGVAVLVGRESGDPVIDRALAPHDIVSRRHARITATGRMVRIEDLNSANGTHIDDRQISPHTPVERPTPVRLRLGSSIHLEVQ